MPEITSTRKNGMPKSTKKGKGKVTHTPSTTLSRQKTDDIKPSDLHNNIIEQFKLAGDNNNLTTDDIFRMLDLYFYKEFYTYRHLHDSFDKFIDDTIPRFFTEVQHVFSELITDDKYIQHMFTFENVRPESPKLSNGIDPMFPADARHLATPYSMIIYGDVTQKKRVTDINTSGKNNVTTAVVGRTEMNRPIMIVPTMVRSKHCNLNVYKEETHDECRFDPGGHFIINGSEKVVICQDTMIRNHPMVFVKKNSNVSYNVVQVNSKSNDAMGMLQAISIKIKKDGVMIVKVPILYEVNVMILFRALGIESDKDIIEYCAYDKTDQHMIEKLRASLEACVNDNDESEPKIQTQDEAIDYLITKMKVVKQYSQSNVRTKLEQKRLHLMELLKTSFLPHIRGSPSSPYREKAYYLGYMVNKLLNVELKRVPVDNRDAYTKKRVDNVRELLEEIMLQQYKNNMAECNRQFMARMDDDIDSAEPFNVIHQFKAGTFEQGFKASLMLGNWPRKKGVSQMLQRFSYMQLLSFLSRIDSQSGTQASSKLTKPRQVDPSSIPFLCCVTADTEILMSDNASVVKIQDIKNGDSVRTVYKDDLREISTPITNYFSRMANDVIEITTISGRNIKCTKDHPILIRRDGKYVMVNAGELNVNDQVIVRHTEKYLELDKDVNVIVKISDIKNKDYIDVLRTLGYLDKPIDQRRLEIFARLIGASVTDGHLRKITTDSKKEQYYAEFYLGEEEDVFEIFSDIQNLGFGSSSVARRRTEHINRENGKHTIYHTWRVGNGGEFSYMMNILGAFVGDKTLQSRSIPEWIVNGNNRIKHEFLSGFNGGDGSRISMQSNVNEYKLALGGTCQTTVNDQLDECVKYMSQIKNMYEELGVSGRIGQVKPEDEPTKTRVFFYPSQSYDNIGAMAEIGYRYCNEKRRASAPIIEYVKYKNFVANKKRADYEVIKDLYNQGNKPQAIVKETGIQYSVVKRIIENMKKGHTPVGRQVDNDSLKYGDFKNNYYIGNLNLAMPIKSIIDCEPEMVYDFTTVLDSHTFIANGLVVSNCISTPEHAKIGLIKHLTMMGSLTIGDRDNNELVEEFIMKHPLTKNRYEVPVSERKNQFIIFLNGEPLKVIDNKYDIGDSYYDNPVMKFYADAKEHKISGKFNPQMTSIVFDYKDNEIRFNTDSGRLYRPVIRVNGDNEMMLTKEMINGISLKATDKGKISDWDEFYAQDPYPIEFVDSEEQPYLMIAEDRKVLNYERKKILDSKNHTFKGEESKIINRYGENFYNRYDYVEIHPSVLLSEIATNIPFCNRNCAPRNIFQYAQGRQGMGIYNTVYRSRTDISYVLYNPEVPVVNTRTSKYTYTDILPSGANAVVSICCYSGYNQEDSLVLNLTSLQRGLFRSMSLRKHTSSITKNQETSGDDKFMKPPPDKTIGIKNGQYDKLNEQGYVPEETVLTNGDVIFGKVTPINDTSNSGKIFKDASEQFKSIADGVMDRVYVGIKNQDGYETRKGLVRSERFPHIGDKFCLTSDHEVLTTKGWISIDKITKNDYVATLVDDNTLKYEKPSALQKLDHDGDMYVVDSNQVNLKVTPNHRMYVADRQGNEFKIELAQDIKGKRRKYKKDVDIVDMSNLEKPRELRFAYDHGCVSDGPTHLIVYGTKAEKNAYDKQRLRVQKKRNKDISEESEDDIEESESAESNDEVIIYEFEIDPLVELLGIWMAEGCVTNGGSDRGRQIYIAAHKQRVKDKLDEIADELGIIIYKCMERSGDEGKNSWRIADKCLVKLFDPLSVGAINKSLPDWVWFLNREQSRKLLNGMVLGDGHAMKGTTTIRYDTSSVKLRDDFQRLCLHASYASNYVVKYEAGHTTTIKSRYGKALKKPETITSNVDAYRLSVVMTQTKPLVNKNIKVDGTGGNDRYEHFNGNVYCCTVPSGIIYVRRAGLPVWVGNCSKHGQKGTMGIGLRGIDMPFTKHGIRPDIIMNANAIPSRMTIGQLWECLLGKIGALKGMNMDGTPFEDYDIEKMKDILESIGYQRDSEEYLYNGMTGKMMKHMIFIGPTYYQRLKHMVQDKMHCVSADTEVLTSNGWKLITDITKEDTVATLVNDHLEYEQPTAIHTYQNYEGDVYYIKNQHIDMIVTGEHRMFVAKQTSAKDDEWSDFGLEFAKDIVGEIRRYKRDAKWVINEDNAISDEQLYEYIRLMTPDDILPDWVWNLSREQCSILIHYLILKNQKMGNEHSECFYTISTKSRDDFQRLCLHAGLVGTFTSINIKGYELWKVSIVKMEEINPIVNHNSVDEEERLVKEKRPMYCISVPSEVFYIRRNGKTCWTGNSRSRGPVTVLTRSAPEGLYKARVTAKTVASHRVWWRHTQTAGTSDLILICISKTLNS